MPLELIKLGFPENALPKEYKWQEEIKIEIQMNKQVNKFYRIRIEEY